jgi:hypothetical protein
VRSRELVSTTNELLQKINITPELILAISQSVLSINIRTYRSALAINQKMDNKEKRAYIFREYEKIDKISQAQRLANTLVVPADDIRPWFQTVADAAIAFLESKKEGQNV